MTNKETDETLDSIFLWRIENLSYFDPELHGRSITGPLFLCLNLHGTPFELTLFPKGEHKGDSNLALRLYPTYDHDRLINCEWSFLDADGSPIVTCILRNKVIKRYQPFAFQDCPMQEDVFLTRKSSFLPHDTLTIQCRIFDPNKDFPQAEHISAVSRIEVLEKSFIWCIKKFRSLHLDQEVHTNVQLTDKNRTTNLLLMFSLTGTSLDKAMIKVKIKFKNLHHQYRLKLYISDKGQKAKICVEKSYEFFLDILEPIWVIEKFLSRQDVLQSSSIWLCGDDLIILFNFNIILTPIHDSIENSYHGPEKLKINIPKKNPCEVKSESKDVVETKLNRIKRSSAVKKSNSPTPAQPLNAPDNYQQRTLAILGEDLMALYQEHHFSDFELRSRDVSFPVHKVVLSARSPVFKAMFSGNMQEADSDFLVVPDVDPHTLGRMLTFLYGGTIDTLQCEEVAKLYYAAHKFQVQSLKQECSSILKSNISVSNVSDVLELAERLQDQELSPFVYDFILSHFDEIVVSDEWEKFMTNASICSKEQS